MNRFLKNIVYLTPWLLSDRKFIEYFWELKFGYKLDLDNPETFNEKLNWLKINDRNPLYTTLVDKYEVKKYVSDIIGEEHVIPTLGVWDSFKDIPFDSLPENGFVLKCTHDSGSTVIVKDKNVFDKKSAELMLTKGLKHNFYWNAREWPYKNVKPRIIAESYLPSPDGELKDFKFFCFNGKMKCFKVDFDRFTAHKANYYNEHGCLMEIGEKICTPDFRKFTLPPNIDTMISFAEKLAKGFPFVRVDFYNISGMIYFGEFTFYPGGGIGKFTSDDADMLLGSWLQLPLPAENKRQNNH